MGILSFFQIRRDRREVIDVEKRDREAERLGKPILETLRMGQPERRGEVEAIKKGSSPTAMPRGIQGFSPRNPPDPRYEVTP
jgi:hypothetical protein